MKGPKAFQYRKTGVSIPVPKPSVFQSFSGSGNTLRSNVSTVTRHEDYFFLGTQAGYICRVQAVDHFVKALDPTGTVIAKVSSKAIDGVALIPKEEVILVLSDGKLCYRDMKTLKNETVVVKSKCRTFCVNELEHFNHLFCASVGSDKLVVFEFRRSTRRIVQLQQVSVKGPVLCCSWNGPSICFATNEGYFILDQDYQVIPTGVGWSSGSPSRSPSSKNSSNSPKISSSPLRRLTRVAAGVTSSAHSPSLGAQHSGLSVLELPMVLSIPVAKFLVVGLGSIGITVDSAGSPAGGAVGWSSAPRQLAFCDPFLVALLHDGTIEVHSDQNSQSQFLAVQAIQVPQVSLLAQIPLWAQVHNRMRQVLEVQLPPEDGLAVTESANAECWASNQPICGADSSILMLDAVATSEQVNELFEGGHISRAFDLLDAVLEMQGDPKERTKIVRHFRILAGLALLRQGDIVAATGSLARARLDPRELLVYFPELCLLDYVPRHLVPSGSRGVGPMSLGWLIGDGSAPPEENSVFYPGLLRFLVESRGWEIDDGNGGDWKAVRDQALLHLAVRLAKAGNGASLVFEALDDLVQDPTMMVDPKECEEVLAESNLLHYLAKYFATSGQGIKALEVWSQLAKDGNHESARDAVEFLKRNAKDRNLWNAAIWVFEFSPRLAIEIFFESSIDLVECAKEIVEYLHEIPEYKQLKLCIQFLEHVIQLNKPLKIEEKKMIVHRTQIYENNTNKKIEWINTQLAIEYLSNLVYAEGHSCDHNDYTRICELFNDHLRHASSIDAKALIELTQDEHLKTQRIEVLARLERHTEAIQLLLDGTDQGVQAAERYCVTHHGTTTSSETPFLVLLRALCKSEDALKRQGTFHNSVGSLDGKVSKLLLRFGNYLDPLDALSLIPERVRLVELLPFLEQALPNSIHQLHQGAVVKSLSRAENLMVKSKLMKLESSCAIIGENSRCSKCNKLVGEQPFTLESSNLKNVVHLDCP